MKRLRLQQNIWERFIFWAFNEKINEILLNQEELFLLKFDNTTNFKSKICKLDIFFEILPFFW